jgi:hypothetical protein
MIGIYTVLLYSIVIMRSTSLHDNPPHCHCEEQSDVAISITKNYFQSRIFFCTNTKPGLTSAKKLKNYSFDLFEDLTIHDIILVYKYMVKENARRGR